MTCASKNKFKGGREKDWLDEYLLRRDAFRDEVCVWGGLWWEWFLLYTLLHTTIYTSKICTENFKPQFPSSYFKYFSCVCVWEREKGTERDVYLPKESGCS